MSRVPVMVKTVPPPVPPVTGLTLVTAGVRLASYVKASGESTDCPAFDTDTGQAPTNVTTQSKHRRAKIADEKFGQTIEIWVLPVDRLGQSNIYSFPKLD